MKLRVLTMLLAASMALGLVAIGGIKVAAAAAPATASTEYTEVDPEVYEQMKEVYTKAGAGQDKEGYSYILAYDENVDNAIFVLLDQTGKSSINVVGPVTEEDSWLTITDPTTENTFTFGLKDVTDVGFTMVAQKNGQEIPMEFVDAAAAVDVIAAIDAGTEIINPFDDAAASTEEYAQ